MPWVVSRTFMDTGILASAVPKAVILPPTTELLVFKTKLTLFAARPIPASKQSRNAIIIERYSTLNFMIYLSFLLSEHIDRMYVPTLKPLTIAFPVLVGLFLASFESHCYPMSLTSQNFSQNNFFMSFLFSGNYGRHLLFLVDPMNMTNPDGPDKSWSKKLLMKGKLVSSERYEKWLHEYKWRHFYFKTKWLVHFFSM